MTKSSKTSRSERAQNTLFRRFGDFLYLRSEFGAAGKNKSRRSVQLKPTERTIISVLEKGYAINSRNASIHFQNAATREAVPAALKTLEENMIAAFGKSLLEGDYNGDGVRAKTNAPH